jgi:hypothetical protein
VGPAVGVPPADMTWRPPNACVRREDRGNPPGAIPAGRPGSHPTHQVAIHRWGWTLVVNPDGTTTAWNKDKTKVSVLPGSITAPFVVELAA